MDHTQFKAMLALYGSSVARWDGVSPDEARAFMAGSEDARKLYEEAETLDKALSSFQAGVPDAAMMGRIMRRIGVEPGGGADVLPFRMRAQAVPLPSRKVTGWGLAAGCAAVVVLFAAPFVKTPDVLPGEAPAAQLAAVSGSEESADVEILLADLDAIAEERVEEQEIIGLWRVAAIQSRTVQEQAIDHVLDDLFFPEEAPPQPQDSMDMWELLVEPDSLDL